MNENKLIRSILAASIFTVLIGGPSVSIGPLDLRAFDAVFLILITYIPFWLVSTDKLNLRIPRHRLLWGSSLIYILSAILLPIFGLIIYQYPVGYVVGDMRWIQVSVVSIIFILHSRNTDSVVRLTELVLKYLVLINLLFVVIQYLNWSDIRDTSYLLSLWYPEGASLGEYGYHIGRFAGAQGTSSSLGLISVSAIAIFSVSFINNRKNRAYILLAVILLIASGHRTSIVALIIIGGVLLVILLLKRLTTLPSIYNIVAAGAFSSTVAYILYYFNIGRIRTSDRYREIFDVFSGGQIAELSGRADRWAPVLHEAQQYTFGTLSNPAWVFNDFPAIDSYIIILYIQGGYFLLFVYLLALAMIIRYSIQLLRYNCQAIIPMSLAITIFTHSLMQNTMTSISAKFLFVFSILVIILLLNDQSGRDMI